MKKLILKSNQSLGDMVVMSACIRDLHALYPGEFMTDVRTAIPELWENNPYVYPISDDDPEAEMIDMEYPLINASNFAPWHFLHAYGQFLGSKIGRPVPPTKFCGDVHLIHAEREPFPMGNYWLIVAGGKFDFTIKHWAHDRWQAVVDAFRGRINFVQVGMLDHAHKPLDGALDLRGKTSVRYLIRLLHHCDGVVCPVTGIMHLAAAVPVREGAQPNRPCVVVAGARESPAWEMYPGHQFLHNVGALPCAQTGGCWRSRTVPLGDGDEKDQPLHLCVNTVEKAAREELFGGQWRKVPAVTMPRCMEMIRPEDVIRAIEMYIEGAISR